MMLQRLPNGDLINWGLKYSVARDGGNGIVA
jgi:hypothetical protein